MTECNHLPQVHAYHDDALDAAARSALESHLRGCATCAAELEWLRQLQMKLRSATAPAVPGNLVRNIQEAISQEPYRLATRTGWWLTAAAAMILLACVLQLNWRSVSPGGAAPPAWEVAALIPTSDMSVTSGSEAHERALAQWINQDLALADAGGAGRRRSQP